MAACFRWARRVVRTSPPTNGVTAGRVIPIDDLASSSNGCRVALRRLAASLVVSGRQVVAAAADAAGGDVDGHPAGGFSGCGWTPGRRAGPVRSPQLPAVVGAPDPRGPAGV